MPNQSTSILITLRLHLVATSTPRVAFAHCVRAIEVYRGITADIPRLCLSCSGAIPGSGAISISVIRLTFTTRVIRVGSVDFAHGWLAWDDC